MLIFFFFFSSRRRHTRWNCDWSSDVCSSDLGREALHGAAPPEPRDGEGHRGGHRHLAEIAGEVVGAESRPPPPVVIGVRHEGGGQRVLDARAEPGGEETAEQGQVASRESGGDEAQRGGGRPRGEKPCLAPALGEQSGGNLKSRHGPAICGAQETDLGEGEAELTRPDGEEYVENVGEAVVDEMRAAGGAEDGASAAHAADCVIEVTRALAS